MHSRLTRRPSVRRASVRSILPAVLSIVAAALALNAAASASAGSPAAGVAAERRPFTIEQVLSGGFTSDLVAATAGGRVAWVLEERGARNVWVAGPPEYKGRKVTSYTADDGQEISPLRFTPDGRAIVYVRGGEPTDKGEYPNPGSDPEGVTQAVWIVPCEGGEPRRLGEGGEPAVSPRGDRVAFVKGGKILAAPLDGSAEAKELLQARGKAGTLRWSPDGGRLAFVSDRDDHAFIGVYDVAAKTVRYLDPAVDTDMEPTWSPDGRSVAFIRLPSAPGEPRFVPHRSGPPWSIRVADAGTGRGRLVWQAREGRGSVFPDVDAKEVLLWVADDRLVFLSEADGWRHLYSITARGGDATLLTPGDFEVEDVFLGAGGKELLYSSNQGDIERRHIWRVPVEGGRPAAVTSGGGIEWSPVATSDAKAIAFIRSDARRPGRPAIVTLEGGKGGARNAAPRDLIPRDVAPGDLKPRDVASRDPGPGAPPAEFPADALVEPRPLTFPAADGVITHGLLFEPPAAGTGRKRPAVIFLHGGPVRQMLPGWHSMDYYHNAYGFNQYLASRGYVVLALNYRCGIGYGMEYREALNKGAAGASEFQDLLGAALYLRGRADVDPERIGLWGGSYGGYLTALGLARASAMFAAGVDIHGVHDWNVAIRNFVPLYDPKAQPEVARLAFESSPMASVKDWRSPVLLIHADDDRNVPFSETVTLATALRKQGVPFEQLVIPDDTHHFLIHAHWIEVYEATAEFLDRHLMKKGP